MTSCELCGRSMKGHGRNVTIEGAKMQVCPQCDAKFGSQSSGPERKSSSAPRTQPSWTQTHSDRAPPSSTPRRPSTAPKKTSKSPRRSPATLDEMILIENYAQVIRNARQKAKMSQEELAQRVGERISTLQAIESGRIKPTKKTIRGLERELEISLLEDVGPIPIKASQGVRGSGPTLGDRVIVKRKKSQKSD